MNTKNYLQIDIRERAKQSWVEEQKYPKRLHKAVAQSGCTRQKALVRERGGLIHLLAR